MAEPQIDASKPSVARPNVMGWHSTRRDSRPRLSSRAKLGSLRYCRQHVHRKNLLRQSHRARRSLDRWQENFPLHARNVKRKQPAILNHLPSDLVLPSSKFTERNFLPRANPVDQSKVGRCQQPQVLAVLLLDALNILGNRNLNPSTYLRIRRLLATRSFPPPL